MISPDVAPVAAVTVSSKRTPEVLGFATNCLAKLVEPIGTSVSPSNGDLALIVKPFGTVNSPQMPSSGPELCQVTVIVFVSPGLNTYSPPVTDKLAACRGVVKNNNGKKKLTMRNKLKKADLFRC